jgi:catechol 2,3-dioxygenase-like lactoylglutathione lyase family enzyme
LTRLPPPKAIRPIDHVVLAVRDLDAAAAFYERLGFLVGPRNRHPWGTENRIIQFATCFIELITVGEGADIPPHRPGFFSFGAYVRDYLERCGEGIAMLAMRSPNAEYDRKLFEQGEIGSFETFRFERPAVAPDGAPSTVAFSLTFAQSEKIRDAGFFVCQHHNPENFWHPSRQQHPNGALGINALIMVAKRPKPLENFFRAFCGTPQAKPIGEGFGIGTPNGSVDIITQSVFNATFGVTGKLGGLSESPRFAALSIHAAPGPIAAHLDAIGMPYEIHGFRVVIPAKTAFGFSLVFSPSPPPKAI